MGRVDRHRRRAARRRERGAPGTRTSALTRRLASTPEKHPRARGRASHHRNHFTCGPRAFRARVAWDRTPLKSETPGLMARAFQKGGLRHEAPWTVSPVRRTISMYTSARNQSPVKNSPLSVRLAPARTRAVRWATSKPHAKGSVAGLLEDRVSVPPRWFGLRLLWGCS